MKLEGKVAVVTGSSRGVGRSVALAFGREGADVVVNYSRSEGAALEVVENIKKMGQQAIAVKADVARRDDAQSLLKAAGEAFGKVDVLVNNAATNPAMGPIVDTEESVYDHIMETNLKGYFVMSQLVGKIMRDQKSGVIINVSSDDTVSDFIVRVLTGNLSDVFGGKEFSVERKAGKRKESYDTVQEA